MDGNTVLLITVVATALAFDFTNGFHDTANAMAASIVTGALRPKVAVALSGVLNFVGAFLSLSVAATIAKGIVDSSVVTLTVVFASLVGDSDERSPVLVAQHRSSPAIVPASPLPNRVLHWLPIRSRCRAVDTQVKQTNPSPCLFRDGLPKSI